MEESLSKSGLFPHQFQHTSRICFPLHVPEAVPLATRFIVDRLRPVCGLLFSIITLTIVP